MDKLSNGSTKQILGNACGQERYKRHIESHCEKIYTYFEKLKLKKGNFEDPQDLIYIRNKVVRDIFKIMRGESYVNP
ncbi:MAG: hypothetical protein AAF208_09530 [Cyanobacteria bacterium P01_A01_bin.45]